MLAAAEEDMGDGLSPFAALAARASDVWYSSVGQEVVQPDLLGAQLYQ